MKSLAISLISSWCSGGVSGDPDRQPDHGQGESLNP